MGAVVRLRAPPQAAEHEHECLLLPEGPGPIAEDGGDLSRHLENRWPPSPVNCIRWFGQFGTSVAAACLLLQFRATHRLLPATLGDHFPGPARRR